jgi:hypothetical protein
MSERQGFAKHHIHQTVWSILSEMKVFARFASVG